MSNYVLSLNADDRGNCCGILLNKYDIQGYLYKNKSKSFDDFVEEKILPMIKLTDNDIILDEKGYGRILKESLLKYGIRIAYKMHCCTDKINKLLPLCYKDAIKNLDNIKDDGDKVMLNEEFR